MTDIMIDHVEKISASLDIFHNELGTLQYLRFGLLSLAGNTRDIEIKLNNEKGLVLSFGTHMGGALTDRETAIVACFFHWYANSICNYVRLVRYIQCIVEHKEIIINPTRSTKAGRINFYNEYLNIVIPEIIALRNKVSAHFAKTDPKEENLATLEASVMFPVTFKKPYLSVGGLKWNSNGQTSELPEWSLTQTFENLRNRYWPNIVIKSFV